MSQSSQCVHFSHSYDFDPRYGYSLEQLLEIKVPAPPADFADYWRQRYQRALQVAPCPQLQFLKRHRGFEIYQIQYTSTDQTIIRGWLLLPVDQAIVQAIVIGHGYGGRDAPDFHIRIPGTALLFPCARGISLSRCETIPDDPAQHVVHQIDDRMRYVLGGCVEDIWLAVSSLLALYPQLQQRIHYMGISFGGGIGALALAWDPRIQKAHLNVPSFGHQMLRLQLKSIGSAEAMQRYAAKHPEVVDVLRYFDAASAAAFTTQPVHVAPALFDPVVAPPGQFAVYNAYQGSKALFVLDAGHFEYPGFLKQQRQLIKQLYHFFLG